MQGELNWFHPVSFVATQVANPYHCLDIADFLTITRCGRKICVLNFFLLTTSIDAPKPLA